ncbi:hypothetical protein A2U01_0061671 [Trifolium medium]|uniref:Uncharacterized protein n=1 Tax=Trifolium medium TaxID=97028 RepID=A0A392RUX8_9FABA|nr:hypothetical protein [Trifolium medium]
MLDVAAIVGLNPYGEIFHPDRQSSNPIKVHMKKIAYTSFMANNIGKTEIISEEEHHAFLLMMLTYAVFCSSSACIGQSLLPLAKSILDG